MLTLKYSSFKMANHVKIKMTQTTPIEASVLGLILTLYYLLRNICPNIQGK